MFKVEKSIVVAKNEKKYISFPDIVKSPKKDGRFFLVYREGNSHHPTWSKIILMKSEDYGETWKNQQEFPLKIRKDNYVWNCPRLSYVDNILYITCDMKSSVFEGSAHFKTVHLTSTTEGEFFRLQETMIPGMVPDKIIEFKDKLFCANHKIKSNDTSYNRKGLIQLVSWSRDRGKTWYDTNIMADSDKQKYCEASVVNMGNYLIAYLRENSGHKKNIYTVTSNDGIYWSKPKKLSIFGQRVTAIKDGDTVIGTYRNSEIKGDKKKGRYRFGEILKGEKCHVSIFEHNLENYKISFNHIDWEYYDNQYHFGYTGIAKISDNKYLVTYYIMQDAKKPFIKLAFVSKIK